jgi:hypothetical protein
MPTPERQDTWLVTAVLEGRDLGIFDSTDGGDLDSDENKYPLGGMLGEISLGGHKSVGELTIVRYYDFARDHPMVGFYNYHTGVGRGQVGFTPLDFRGIPRGAPFLYVGTLKTFVLPTVDNTSQDAATMELHWTIERLLP